MKDRCANKNNQDYWRYGGAGVTFSKRWQKYHLFLQDMGRKPAPGYTLDRKRNSGNYTKRNCRWATRKTQAQNRGAYNNCTMQIASRIRNLYKTGEFIQVELAARFGIAQAVVSRITRNVSWIDEKGGEHGH
jgi:hypothetical protein